MAQVWLRTWRPLASSRMHCFVQLGKRMPRPPGKRDMTRGTATEGATEGGTTWHNMAQHGTMRSSPADPEVISLWRRIKLSRLRLHLDCCVLRTRGYHNKGAEAGAAVPLRCGAFLWTSQCVHSTAATDVTGRVSVVIPQPVRSSRRKYVPAVAVEHSANAHASLQKLQPRHSCWRTLQFPVLLGILNCFPDLRIDKYDWLRSMRLTSSNGGLHLRS